MSGNLPALTPVQADVGGALAPAPVPQGSPAGGGRSAEYDAALNVRFENPKLYHSPAFQARLLELAQGKVEAPAHDTVAGIQAELGAGFMSLAEGFGTLPAPAIAAVESELIAPLVSSRTVSTATLERMRQDAPVAALLEEWGRDAPRLAARVCERVQRLFYRTDSPSWNALADWYDRLDGDEAIAVTRALSR